MSGIRAILTDLDGTVLFPNGDFSEATKIVIEEMARKNIVVMPVTGRSYRSSIDVCRSIGFQGLGVFKGGSMIVDIPSGEILWERPIEKSTARAVLEDIAPFCKFLSFGHGRLSADQTTNLLSDDLHCLSIWAEVDTENLDRVLQVINQYADLAAYVSAAFNDEMTGIQINHVEANKQFGAKKLLELVKIDRLEALAIGDDNNDLPFFMAVGTSVAMGNSPKELRRTATYTTTTVDEDGFKNAMTRYALS